METIIYIEIPVEVTFSPNPGYPQTRHEPGEPAHVEDLDYDKKQVIKAIDEAIYGPNSTVDEELLEFAEEQRRNPF